MRSAICFITEEAVVSGWNLSQDAFIPTCLVLGKCESEWLGAEMRMGDELTVGVPLVDTSGYLTLTQKL